MQKLKTRRQDGLLATTRDLRLSKTAPSLPPGWLELIRVAYRTTRNMDETEDVVQESFMICLHQFYPGVSRGDLAPDRCECCIKAFSADMRSDESKLMMIDG